ncbi:MAG TPA: C4-dicarboxylate transporter DctA [Polyangia bacterium]
MPSFAKGLYAQVLAGVALGILIGLVRPAWGVALKPLGDGFVRLIKMMIAPIIFSTVVGGIAHAADMRKVGRVGLKALLYFEVLTSVALMIGLGVGHVIAPGAGIHADPRTLDAHLVETYATAGKHLGATDFLLGIIPTTVGEAFTGGDILQILLVSVLVGVAAAALGSRVAAATTLIEQVGQLFFRMVALVMRLAPLGAMGAMAFTVGKFGIASLAALAKMMLAFYATSVLFVLVVLGLVARQVGFGIVPFVRFIREEIFVVLGTSSSESALPLMMAKMERLGCPRAVVGLVIPTGYSFNLDGTSIYLSLATLFIAQALDIQLPLADELGLLAVLLLTSKGAAAVTGGGFVTLAATLGATGKLPVAGLALLLGVDRFMSEARAITNLIGNGVATLAIARWEGELDMDKVRATLASPRAAVVAGAVDASGGAA